MIVNKKNNKKKACQMLTYVILNQLTIAVLISQRHKIESSGFFTIDVLYKNRRKRHM